MKEKPREGGDMGEPMPGAAGVQDFLNTVLFPAQSQPPAFTGNTRNGFLDFHFTGNRRNKVIYS
jgi:hypothetical protein